MNLTAYLVISLCIHFILIIYLLCRLDDAHETNRILQRHLDRSEWQRQEILEQAYRQAKDKIHSQPYHTIYHN